MHAMELTEQAGTTAGMQLAILQARAQDRPDDARGLAETAKAIQSVTSSLRDLHSTFMDSLEQTVDVDVAAAGIDAIELFTDSLADRQPDERGVYTIELPDE